MLAQVDPWVWIGAGDLYAGLKQAGAGVVACIALSIFLTWMIHRKR